jgi:hypothetical protein
MSPKVMAVVEPVLTALGCEPDSHAWVAWGDDPSTRYVIFVPTPPGLVHCHVRVNLGGEGPRASGKIVRWNRLQLGELGMETQGGHRMISFQVEQQILRGSDAEADRIAAFAISLFAAVDGRPMPEPAETGRRARGSRQATSASKRTTAAAKPETARAAAKPGPGGNAKRAGAAGAAPGAAGAAGSAGSTTRARATGGAPKATGAASSKARQPRG